MGAPAFLEPWLDRFYEPAEIRLLLRLASADAPTDAVARALGFADADLRRAWRRGALDDPGPENLRPADFRVRFDLWALFEGWKDLPDDVREALNRWELDRYVADHRDRAEAIRAGETPDARLVTPRYVLPDEAEAILRRVDRVYLWPCNCRSMFGNCGGSVFTCLRFSNDRDRGWEIGRERAVSVMKAANRAGLMQSAELGLDESGRLTGAICNCCADCCFPHRLAEELDAPGVWPKRRHVARFRESRCVRCGRCAKRCPFDAFAARRNAKGDPPEIRFHPDRCRGCGLCAAGCPSDAIAMDPLETGGEWEPWRRVEPR